MGRQELGRIGGVFAVLGGGAWTVKGGWILATGVQPPLLFELAPGLLALGLVGLYLRSDPASRAAAVGMVFACLALAAWVVSLGAPAGDGEFAPAMLAATLALLAGLVALGLATRRSSALGPGVISSLPLWLGVLTFPALAVGGALAVLDERLLEVPVVALGLAWVVLGTAIARVPPRAATA